MRVIIKIVLAIQILFPLFVSASSVSSAIELDAEATKNHAALSKVKSRLPELASGSKFDSHFSSEEQFASALSQTGQIMSGDNRHDTAKNWLENSAYSYLSGQMQNWLNQYGNSRIQIDNTAFSAELLLPLFENSRHLIFSQSRLSREDENRKTLNVGLGYRHFADEWMWGFNSFYDRDLNNNNARWGAGLELGANYVKLATNGYFRLTDWRQSKLANFASYNERPANGFDIRAEGFLPIYPNIGANLQYEKYFGENINLKRSNSLSNLKDDPEAYRVGLSYTPVPLVSFKLNQTMGDVNETIGAFELNYRLGVPLNLQLDSQFVAEMRTLKGSRYNFVDRNNAIVMQYQKQALLRLSLPKALVMRANEPAHLQPTISKNEYQVDHIEWSASSLTAKGGTLVSTSSSPYLATITMPFYDATDSLDSNRYEVTAVAVDIKGNRSNMATTHITVTPAAGNETIASIDISPSSDIVADGETAGIVTLQVKDTSSGQALADVAVDFSLESYDGKKVSGVKLDGKDEATLTRITDSKGYISFPITSIKAGNYRLNSSIDGREPTSSDISFIADSRYAQISENNITILGDSTIANGVETYRLKIRVTDANDNGIADQLVDITADNDAVVGAVEPTDPNGEVIITISSTKPGSSNVTAAIGEFKQVFAVDFTINRVPAQIADGAISVETNHAVADGVNTNKVKVKVTDTEGNGLAGRVISLTADNSAVVGTISPTDVNGEVVVTLSSIKSGSSNIKARIDDSTQAFTVDFIADSSTAHFDDESLSYDWDLIDSNKIPIIAKVVDANDNPVGGAAVNVTANNGAVVDYSGFTDETGEINILVTTALVGDTHVTLSVGKSKKTLLLPVFETEYVSDIRARGLSVLTNGAFADGISTNSVKVKVTDFWNDAMEGVKIGLTADNGTIVGPINPTDSNGEVIVTLTNMTAGKSTITATFNNYESTIRDYHIDVNFIEPDTGIKIDSNNFTIINNNAPADGAKTNSVKAKVTDKDGNPLAGKFVYFVASNSATMDNVQLTDVNGEVIATLTSTTPGESVITAIVGSSKQITTVNFTEDLVTTNIGYLSMDSFSYDLSNDVDVDTHYATIKVLDKDKNPLEGILVKLTADADVVIGTVNPTDDKGETAVVLSSSNSGFKNVTASIGKFKSSHNTWFNGGSTTAQIASVEVETNNASADGIDSNKVRVKVVNLKGQPLNYKTINITADNGTVVSAIAPTNSKGYTEVKLTNTTMTNSTIKASITSKEGKTTSKKATVAFSADSKGAQIDSGNFTVVNNGAVADGISTNKVKVKVTDAKGNPLANQKVHFFGAAKASIDLTDKNGEVIVALTSTTAGSIEVTASIGESEQKIVVNFIADINKIVKKSFIFVLKDGALADGISANQVLIALMDNYDNPIIGERVNFSAEDVTFGEIGLTDEYGQVVVNLTSKKSGYIPVTATYGQFKETYTMYFSPYNESDKIEDEATNMAFNDVAIDDNNDEAKFASL
ncbi:Ig-like domain-containing protein [Orbus sturtevantii]|uniref:Ig-like domain-containing protein n=1 Tax=Orbus sturtevantii TaxID=3074109 RepID=UPI00370D8968